VFVVCGRGCLFPDFRPNSPFSPVAQLSKTVQQPGSENCCSVLLFCLHLFFHFVYLQIYLSSIFMSFWFSYYSGLGKSVRSDTGWLMGGTLERHNRNTGYTHFKFQWIVLCFDFLAREKGILNGEKRCRCANLDNPGSIVQQLVLSPFHLNEKFSQKRAENPKRRERLVEDGCVCLHCLPIL